jgi:hypothetical protein
MSVNSLEVRRDSVTAISGDDAGGARLAFPLEDVVAIQTRRVDPLRSTLLGIGLTLLSTTFFFVIVWSGLASCHC